VLAWGWWAPLAYGLLCAQPLVPMPSIPLFMAAGMAFGLAGGGALVVVGGTLRGGSQFLLARALGRDAVSHLLRGRLAAMDRWAGRNSFETVLWTRAVAPIPFDLQNVGFGLSGIAFRPYIAATALGLIPIGLIWVWAGSSVVERPFWHGLALAAIPVALLQLVHRRFRARPRTMDGPRSRKGTGV
jgi:uncharacterized membrane protein YdjX (TVP38/TMEM64 family)